MSSLAQLAPWSLGVFTSVDAGLGVHLDVAQELGIPTVQVHAPHKPTRTEAAAQAFLDRCRARYPTCPWCHSTPSIQSMLDVFYVAHAWLNKDRPYKYRTIPTLHS